MAKGNDGSAARRRTVRKVLLAASIALGLTIIIILSETSEETHSNYPGHRQLPEHSSRYRDMVNRARHQERNDQIDDMAGASNDVGDGDIDPNAPVDEIVTRYRKDLIAGHMNPKRAEKFLDGVLDGAVHLADINMVWSVPRTDDGSYSGVKAAFCKLNFSLHKKNPEEYPMFRFIVHKSPCENPVHFDLRKMVYLARHHDKKFEASPDREVKVLNMTAVAFHESRCGSTLIANSMIAMDPQRHRVYSEAAPAIKILNLCGQDYNECTKEQVVSAFKDTLYLLSRSNDPQEERVFFKFQSSLSTKIDIFQTAFPEVPWMYIYRDPVQVMMSHIKDDASMRYTICTRSSRFPPPEIEAIAKRHGRSGAYELTKLEYCAAHLAHLTEAAVGFLNDEAIPIAYSQLPNIMWETVMPKILGRPLEAFEIDNLQKISGIYSKGNKLGKKGEYKDDTKEKERAASDEVREASKEILSESFQQLTDFEPPILK